MEKVTWLAKLYKEFYKLYFKSPKAFYIVTATVFGALAGYFSVIGTKAIYKREIDNDKYKEDQLSQAQKNFDYVRKENRELQQELKQCNEERRREDSANKRFLIDWINEDRKIELKKNKAK